MPSPVASIADLDRATLARLGREWLLHGHLQDRVGMALVMETQDRVVMQDVAVDEWMAASPVYSRRMQQAMRFPGTGVETILKNLQLDIGAPHQFMDFRLRLIDDEHGEFFLAHCGALMDVEPLGEDFVRGMCHAIEDPTFDATAAATNPLAQIRPIHRPPRLPADRVPHCHWRIDIQPGAVPAEPNRLEAMVADSKLARLPVIQPAPADDNGWTDYSGRFDPGFALEDLSRQALLVVLDEFAIQSHLLLRSFLLALADRDSPARTTSVLPRLIRGWCGLTTQRLRDAFELPATAAGLGQLIVLHPMFAPARYIRLRLHPREDSVRLAVLDCPATEEADRYGWLAAMDEAMAAALESVLQAFDPRVRCERVAGGSDEVFAFRARIEAGAPPLPECAELAIAKLSTGARFRFSPRRARPA